MEFEEIFKKASEVEGLEGMTVNEWQYVSGLMKVFDASKWRNRDLARTILKAFNVDELSINKILD